MSVWPMIFRGINWKSVHQGVKTSKVLRGEEGWFCLPSSFRWDEKILFFISCSTVGYGDDG